MNTNKEYVYVPISYEYMMSQLFGKQNYHGHVGSLTKTSWKKDLKKINKYIIKSINLNVKTDSYHKKRLVSICEKMDEKISSSRSLNDINVVFVESYVKLIFNLLGNFPSHWEKKSPYADRFWNLSGHRAMCFTQTDEQKSALVIHLVDVQKTVNVELNNHENMLEVFWSFGSNSRKFIEWLKSEHPRVYCEIF